MGLYFRWGRLIPTIMWVGAVIAIVVWGLFPGYLAAWDLKTYKQAILSLQQGHDPYLDCVLARQWFFSHPSPGAELPFGYVYPPITLPLLRWIGSGPLALAATLYWTVYLLCAGAMLWVGSRMTLPQERNTFAYLLPAAIFFPGLLQYDCLFSGNVAYIGWGLLLAAAAWGWRTGKWAWLYAAVFVASAVKITFLCALGIPVLSARRQWLAAVMTGSASLGLFAMQARLWPEQWRNFQFALTSQMIDHGLDFGFHPAGLLSGALFHVMPYRLVFAVVYAVCTALLATVLLPLRRRYLDGQISLRQWVPLMVLGVALLNPRIMEYDAAPLTIPMALIAWRFFATVLRRRGATILAMSTMFLAANIGAVFAWKPAECLLLVGLFAAGAWTLHTQKSSRTRAPHTPRAAAAPMVQDQPEPQLAHSA